MQSLVNIIRGTRAHNIILLPGLSYANQLNCASGTTSSSCGFLDSVDHVRVSDTLSQPQLAAVTDNYPWDNVCGGTTTTCYSGELRSGDAGHAPRFR